MTFEQHNKFASLLERFQAAGGKVLVEDKKGWFRNYTLWKFSFNHRELDPIKGSDLVYPSINKLVSKWIKDCLRET